MARSTTKTQADHQHAIASLRVSTSGQGKDGVSLEAQRSTMAAWCEVRGSELVQVCEDHPELREPNPERQKALEAWREDTLEEEEEDHGEAR